MLAASAPNPFALYLTNSTIASMTNNQTPNNANSSGCRSLPNFGTDPSTVGMLNHLKPEAQQLCRILMQQLSTTNGETMSISQSTQPQQPQPSPTVAFEKRVSNHLGLPIAKNIFNHIPEERRQQPPPPPFDPFLRRSIDSEFRRAQSFLHEEESSIPFAKQTSPSPANFSMTAAITSALSSNSTAVGPQLLPACSPLLQLAVRQALNECLPNFSNLNIQGNLEISIDARSSNGETRRHSTTVLKFTDEEPFAIERRSSIDVSRISGETNLSILSANATSSPTSAVNSPPPSMLPTSFLSGASMLMSAVEELSIPTLTGSGLPITLGSSRRKSFNPIKCSPEEMNLVSSIINSTAQTSLPLPNTSFSPMTTTTTINPTSSSHSGPNSPSADSGVLDLSRNGSLISSAPITPLKDIQSNMSGQSSFLDTYQKQLIALDQLQSMWNRASASTNEFPINDLHFMTNFSSHHSKVLQQQKQQQRPLAVSLPTIPLSTPSSLLSTASCLTKSTTVNPTPRRQRIVNRSSTIGRMCALRRPNTSRRFPCNQCHEEFPSLHTLEEHTMYKHGTYRCHICKAQFTQRSNLQRHALKHVGFKPFECRVCSKAYYRKDHLMRHMEMGHPGHTPRENITVHLTSSESLDFLNRTFPPLPLGTETDLITMGQTRTNRTLTTTAQDHDVTMLLDDREPGTSYSQHVQHHSGPMSPDMTGGDPHGPSTDDSSPYREDLIQEDIRSERRDSDYSLGDIIPSNGSFFEHKLPSDEEIDADIEESTLVIAAEPIDIDLSSSARCNL